MLVEVIGIVIVRVVVDELTGTDTTRVVVVGVTVTTRFTVVVGVTEMTLVGFATPDKNVLDEEDEDEDEDPLGTVIRLEDDDEPEEDEPEESKPEEDEPKLDKPEANKPEEDEPEEGLVIFVNVTASPEARPPSGILRMEVVLVVVGSKSRSPP